MKFGKVEHPRQLNAPIPQLIPKIGSQAENPSKPSTPLRIHLGAPVWGKKEWVGKLYPPKTQAKDYLKYYALQMNSIELNTTYYRIPDPTTVQNWKQVVPEDFTFCPKVYMGISQFGKLAEIPEITKRFCETSLQFEKNLGVCFLQLPPYFGPERILILNRFFKLLPSQLPLAIEFRHPGWFHRNQIIDLAFQLLSDHQISPVITDALGRPDVLHSSLSTQKVMIRFLGNSLHSSDYARLDQWVSRIGEWAELGIRDVYFFIHQHEEEGVIELVQYLVEQLNETYEIKRGIRLKGIDLNRAMPQIELF